MHSLCGLVLVHILNLIRIMYLAFLIYTEDLCVTKTVTYKGSRYIFFHYFKSNFMPCLSLNLG